MSDLCGPCGRRIRKALGTGERHPHPRAALAMGTLRRKLPTRALALTGQCTEHHGRLIQGAWALTDLLERQIAALDEQMRQATDPCAPQREPRHSLPGIKGITARDLIAEMGAERRRVGSAKRLASWVGACPGHDESAGGNHSHRSPNGNRQMRRVLNQAANAAVKTKGVSLI